jgi:hypothetical protein
MISGRSAAHQRNKARQLRGCSKVRGSPPSRFAGVHDKPRRQIVAQEAIVRRRDRKVTAQQV